MPPPCLTQQYPTPPSTSTPPSELSIGEVIFSKTFLYEKARSSGFIVRARKINPLNLLASLIEQSLLGSPSYNDLASTIVCSDGDTPSRQAVASRLNAKFEVFLKDLLSHILAVKTNQDIKTGKLPATDFRNYARVLVQDSTVIKLPVELFPSYSGVSNGSSTVCNARIQAVYDLRSAELIEFSIDAYSKNDLLAAPELELKPGDLVLRDRGYLTAGEIQRHCDAQAHCIYRHKTGTVYLDAETHQPIDLAALLKREGHLEMEVLLNNEEQTRVRLLAAPVSEEIANLRRMKAKKETKGRNPSAAVLELMDWTIFITNIPVNKANFKQILGIYGLRWRIEVIFKAWKSHLKFDHLHHVSERQMRIVLKIRLLVIAAASRLYRGLEEVIQSKHKRWLSLLKFMNYLTKSAAHLLKVFNWKAGESAEATLIQTALAKYCCYDKRKKRLNFSEIWEALA